MINVLVTGGKGMLACELNYTLPCNVISVFLDAEQLDISDIDKVRSAIIKYEPTIIINCAAYTAVDAAELEPEKAHQCNDQGVANLAKVCAQLDVKLIHISTDYVFSGLKGSAYLPIDEPHPINVYGKSKRAGERAVLKHMPRNALIIRTSWLYSSYGCNFIKSILSAMQRHEKISVVNDQVGSPTWARGLARVIWLCVLEEDADCVVQYGLCSQIVHWADGGYVSRYGLAEQTLVLALKYGILNQEVVIDPVGSGQFPSPASRPVNSVLSIGAEHGKLKALQVDWTSNLDAMLSSFK